MYRYAILRDIIVQNHFAPTENSNLFIGSTDFQVSREISNIRFVCVWGYIIKDRGEINLPISACSRHRLEFHQAGNVEDKNILSKISLRSVVCYSRRFSVGTRAVEFSNMQQC